SLTVQDEAAERVATAYAELGETAAESYTTSLVEAVTDPTEELAERLATTGTMLPEGLATGITDNSSVAELADQNMMRNVLDAGDSEAQIESPSKKTAESRKNLVLGLQSGINDNKALATDAMTRAAKEVVTEAQTQLGYSEQNKTASVPYSIGLQFDQGLADGIRAGKSEVINAAVEVAFAAAQAARDELGIESPSKVTRELGGYYMEGWVEGIQAKTENLKDAVRGSLNDALIPESTSVSSAGGVTGTDAIGDIELSGSGDTINIIFQPKSMTESELDKAFDYINERFGKAI
ncbi:MAG: hypothetical protein LUE31_03055, partial [Lachnospiraceae bacterium]|nr:hypothetical protein [Lachnospiraceae bacterium]